MVFTLLTALSLSIFNFSSASAMTENEGIKTNNSVAHKLSEETLGRWADGDFSYSSSQTENLRFIFDTDIGFDSDDFLGLVRLLHHVKKKYPNDFKNRVFVSTVFLYPEQKSLIASLILENYGFDPRSSAPGFGVYAGEESTFRDKFYWSNIFGLPANSSGLPSIDDVLRLAQKGASHPDAMETRKEYKKSTYKFQLEGMQSEFPGVQVSKEQNNTAQERLTAFLNSSDDGSVVVISNAAMSNISSLIAKDLDLFKTKVNRIVAMGGWFDDVVNGKERKRLGYNTVLDLDASKVVFDSGVPTLLCSSSFCNQFNMQGTNGDNGATATLSKLESIKTTSPSQIGRAIAASALNWEAHRIVCGSSGDGSILAADIVNTSVAIQPDKVKAQPVKFHIYPEKVKDKKDINILNNDMQKDTGLYEHSLLETNSQEAQKAALG